MSARFVLRFKIRGRANRERPDRAVVEHAVAPVRHAQLISYLRLSKKRVGLLINFNVKWLADEGVRRRVNDFPE